MERVAIVMGSDHDLPVVEKAVNCLKELKVEYEVRVISAHRSPEACALFSRSAEGNGFGAIIAAAGKAAHLAGAIAANTVLPVIGLPIKSSTLDGLERNLTPSEMLDQIYAITRLTGERVSNVVVMGTGEPMDNYNNILKFLHLLTDENGLNISQRNVTVSTCGIVPRMRQLADEKLQITLALSLHATTDEKRRKLMPIANRYSIKELMEVCQYYFEQTGRRITFEYSLVGGVNDTEEDARELIALAKPLCCHINLIPVNPIKERDYVQSDTKHIQAFKNKLESKMIHVTIRREMGRDIDGACGQLRRRHTQEAKNPGELSQEEV